MGRCTVPLNVLYSHAEAIRARCLLKVDVSVRTSELGTGLVSSLHEQLVRERGDVIRSEDITGHGPPVTPYESMFGDIW